MIYIIFLVSIIIYITYLYFKRRKENFISNPVKRKYFLIGKYSEEIETYLQSYENKDGLNNLDYNRKGCNIYDIEENENSIDINNLLDLNTEKSFNYDICSNQIKNILNPDEEDKEGKKYISNIQNGSVIIFSFGQNDIENINNEILMDSSNDISKEVEYKKLIENINLTEFRANNKLTENRYLFLNLKSSKDDYDYENYNLWNEELQKYVDKINKLIINNKTLDESKINLQVINTTKKNVNQNGQRVKEGIPYDLHLFICKNERCDIGNKDCVRKFPSIFRPV